MRREFGIAGWTALFGCLVGSAAMADPFFDASGIVAPLVTGATPVSTFFEGPLNTGGTFSEKAAAGLTLDVAARVSKNAGNSVGGSATAVAEAYFFDVVIDGPAAETTVGLRLPFNLYLTFDSAAWSGTGGESISNHLIDLKSSGSFGDGQFKVEWSTAVPGAPTLTTTNASGQVTPIWSNVVLLSTPPGVTPAEVGTETIALYRVSGEVALPPTTLPTGTQLSLILTAQAHSDATSALRPWAFSGSSVYGFGPRLGAPVFDLEPGYTASSADMHLVDNVIAAPEPSSSALVAVGALGLAALAVGRGR